MTSTPSPHSPDDERAVNLGLRLRVARQKSGLSLRELARRLGVSASFLSQIENGKSQPSVATLYSIAQMLEVSIDHLFSPDEAVANGAADSAVAVVGQQDGDPADESDSEPVPDIPSVLGAMKRQRGASAPADPVRRSDLGSLESLWRDGGGTNRLSVTSPGNRAQLVMDTGVIWEQLATNTAHHLDFMEILYPPGSSSTNDKRMLRHEGFEYGYLMEGELEVTFGFETFTLHAGEALGLDSSVPHLLRNRGTVPARGIWFVHHVHD